MQNSHVPTISISQRNSTSSKMYPLEQINNVIKLCRNDKRKRNVAVTLFQYVMQTDHKKVTQNWRPSTQSICI